MPGSVVIGGADTTIGELSEARKDLQAPDPAVRRLSWCLSWRVGGVAREPQGWSA